jgi:hypothetical protein
VKGDDEKISSHATTDWTRKSNPSRATTSNRGPSLAKVGTLNARVSATTATTTTTSAPESTAVVVETNTG